MARQLENRKHMTRLHRQHVVAAGAQLLVDPTNTSSYLTSQVPTQEIAAARLQAVAEGRDVVQAAPTGFSAVIDHRGRVEVRSKLAVRAAGFRFVALDLEGFRSGSLNALVHIAAPTASGQ